MSRTTINRADALDALRGFAIITMILSGSIPFSGEAALPGWMYHAQLPPPDHVFNPNNPGITWVDLVFPFFLFSMGAAFPFSLSRRMDIGDSKLKLILNSFLRGLLLVFFAIILQHLKPYALSGTPQMNEWLIGLFGFIALFFLYVRMDFKLDKKIILTAKILFGVLLVFLFTQLTYSNRKSFSIGRSDIIIIVLANTAAVGSVIWIFTREKIFIRLIILALLLAFRLTHNIEGSWTKIIWDATPLSEVYRFYFLQYLFIVIPGTIVGDLFLKWMNLKPEPQSVETNRQKFFQLCLMVSFILFNLVTFYNRWLIVNTAGNVALLFAGFILFKKEFSSLDTLYKSIFSWSALWLLLGVLFEPLEGGIKKDPSNVSYYLVTSGLAGFCLILFSIVTDYFRKNKYLQLLIDNGKNPMIAYISGSNLMMPFLALTGISALMNYLLINPFMGFIKGMIFTLLCAYATKFFTKKKLFLRT